MVSLPEDIQNYLPYYLTEERKSGLLKALADFPDNFEYYQQYNANSESLQGDGWRGVQVINFQTGEKCEILGIILSNSCDISPENHRELPARITFAPVIALGAYENLLRKSGIIEQSIVSKLQSIRLQQVTDVFFLPAGGDLEEDHIALLNDLHSMPYSSFEAARKRSKAFMLSMCGFYMFLLKLSIHFCRFHENLDRA